MPTYLDDDGRRIHATVQGRSDRPRRQVAERRVDYPVVTTNSGKTHVEIEASEPNLYLGIAASVVCGALITDGYRSRTGGLVTCQRCLRVIAD